MRLRAHILKATISGGSEHCACGRFQFVVIFIALSKVGVATQALCARFNLPDLKQRCIALTWYIATNTATQ